MPRGKTRVTIQIDDDILGWFRDQAHAAGAVYNLVTAYRARREGRSAMFGAERQAANDRVTRSGIFGLALVGLAFLFLGLALMGAGGAPSAEQATRPPSRTTTPRAGITPSLALTPTRQPTSSLPTVPPPATNTPRSSPARRTWAASRCARRPTAS